MILLIDNGNTNLKWNLRSRESGELQTTTRLLAHAAPDFSAQLEKQWGSLEGVSGVWIVNVAGEKALDTIRQWVMSRWNLTLQLAETRDRQTGVTNAYTQYEQLGTDRWLAMLAAHHQYPDQPVCVIDCGTTITADLITGSGQHKGGMIVPGPRLMKTALVQGADGIHETGKPPHKIETSLSQLLSELPITEWGKNTGDCIRHGAVLASLGFIRQVIVEAEKTIENLAVVITGGDAQEYIRELPDKCEHRPDLVLQGLSLSLEEK